MPIRPYLNDEAFDPEQIRAMSWALEQVCNSLHVLDDRSRETVAVRIIELARCGVHNGIALRERVLREANVARLGADTPLIQQAGTGG